MEKLETSNDLLEQGEGVVELLAFVFWELPHSFGQGFDAALAAFPHQADTLGRGFEADAAAVCGGVTAHQSRALEAGDDAAHGWRADLFGVGKLAKRPGPAEDQDRKRGKLGGADAAFAVADAKPAQQVNCSGVKLVGNVRRR